MQLPTVPSTSHLAAVISAMQHERLVRYLPAAHSDLPLVFRFYLWNTTLCEAFHLSLHFAEVVARNALHRHLEKTLGSQWFTATTFLRLLDQSNSNNLARACRDERQQHGSRFTAHHVVSALTFGFWQHLTTKRFKHMLWSQGVNAAFPNAPALVDRQALHDRLETVRRWRNRIAHHNAIFDKGPTRHHYQTLELINWVCPVTASWVQSMSTVPQAVNLRPK